jgi:curved DNA-binding protein CbpA
MNVSKAWLKAMALLGLTHQNQCDDKSIQIAWKRRLLKTHPDKSNLNAQAATALTQEINAAKEFLLQQAKQIIRAQFDDLATKEKQAAAAEQEMRAAIERARQAAARYDLFNTMHARRSSSILPYELQQSIMINQSMQDTLNYEQTRRTKQVRCK